MNNPHLSKRHRQVKVFVSYGVMTLVTIVVSALCILLIAGYRVDTQEGKLEQGSLLQFRSTPAGADIILDGKDVGFVTPGKLSVTAAHHSVIMKKEGYDTWSKVFTSKPGELRWLNYARLIPTTLTTSTITSLSGADEVLASPDKRLIAVIPNAENAVVNIINVSNPKRPVLKTFDLASTLQPRPQNTTSKWVIEEWDIGSRYVLLSQHLGPIIDFIRLDSTITDDKGINLTREYNLPFRQLHFSGRSGNVFYALTDSDLRRIDVNSKSVSQPLVAGVESYSLYREKDIAYVSVRGDKKVAGVYVDDHETTVRTFDNSVNLSIDITKYYDPYLVIVAGRSVQIIKDPVSHSDIGRAFAQFNVRLEPAWLDISNSGRFVVVGNGHSYECYDLETDERFAVTLPGQPIDTTAPVHWIDDYYTVVTTTGNVTITEFDGQNAHEITSVVPGKNVTLSEDGRFLYSVGRTQGATSTFSLQSTSLTID